MMGLSTPAPPPLLVLEHVLVFVGHSSDSVVCTSRLPRHVRSLWSRHGPTSCCLLAAHAHGSLEMIKTSHSRCTQTSQRFPVSRISGYPLHILRHHISASAFSWSLPREVLYVVLLPSPVRRLPVFSNHVHPWVLVGGRWLPNGV